MSRTVSVSDPLPRRLAAWMAERFPLPPYALLVAMFWGAAATTGATTGGSILPSWPAAVVALLVFLHLRIFDEHKDQEADLAAYPDRVLSRGVVTLPLLARLGVSAIALEALLSAWLGRDALLAWAGVLGFTLLMRVEFGVGRWLNRHLVLYALTHNPVVGLLTLYLVVATGAALGWSTLSLVAVTSLGSLAFELGRKIRLPDEEIPGVDSYSSVLGRGRAGLLLGAVQLLTLGATVAHVLLVDGPLWTLAPAVLALAWGSLTARADQPAKKAEGGATGVLLGALISCVLAAAL